MSKYNNFIVKILVVGLVIFGIFNLYNSFFNQKTSEGKIQTGIKEKKLEIFDLSLCDPDTYLKCLEKQVSLFKTNDINQKYILSVYTDVNEILAEKKLDSALCHVLSHKIGEKVYNSDKNLGKAFSVNVYDVLKDYNCSNGYYHGVMLGLSKDTKTRQELINKLKKIISDNQNFIETVSVREKNEQILKDFYHGLGHATYTYSKNKEDALKLCEEILTDKNQQNLCFTGVFMEEAFLALSVEENLDVGICLPLDDEYKNACYAGVRVDKKYVQENLEHYQKQCQNEKNDDNKLSCIRGYISQVGYAELPVSFAKDFCYGFDTKFANICNLYYVNTYSGNMGLNFLEREKVIKDACLSINIFNYSTCKKTIHNYNKFLPIFEHITLKDFE